MQLLTNVPHSKCKLRQTEKLKVKGNGKVHPRTRQEGTGGGVEVQLYSLPSALDGVGG